jgi:hypothetical protein
VVRATLTGRGPVHSVLRPHLDDLRRHACRPGPGHPVWFDRLVDDTAPAVDLAARAGDDDLLGHALRRCGTVDPEAQLARLPPGVAALLDADDRRRAVERAKVLLVDHLGGGR